MEKHELIKMWKQFSHKPDFNRCEKCLSYMSISIHAKPLSDESSLELCKKCFMGLNEEK